MPAIKPVSDLRSYNDVLSDVSEGSPVFLTRNGRGSYVILDMRDYDKMNAYSKLVSELNAGCRSGEQEGWIDAADVKARFASKAQAHA